MKQQPTGIPVDVSNWKLHEDYPVFPVGSKPKRMLICPPETQEGFLIPGHSYLYKIGTGWQAQQLWSEIIAYRMGAKIGLDVPPSFLAVDKNRGEVGTLIEFFFGYPWERRPAQFVPAKDFMDRILTDKKRGRPHSIRINLRLCRALRLPNPVGWWAQVLAFDALIGNTDRHPENWGFLVRRGTGSPPELESGFAPAFDNGTSLGYELPEDKLSAWLQKERLERYVAKGTHHCGWDHSPDAPGPHLDLCKQFAAAYPDAGPIMQNVIRLDEQAIAEIVEDCTNFEVPVPFTIKRAELVASLITLRKSALESALRELT